MSKGEKDSDRGRREEENKERRGITGNEV